MRMKICLDGGKRRRRNKSIYEFLVVWAGYPLEEATWEPETIFPDKTAPSR